MSFGMTGVRTNWMFHCWPSRGCTGMYCSARSNLTGSGPSLTTLPTSTPTGTVQTSPAGAFQFARMLPE